MDALFRIIRLPVYLLGAIGLLVLLPIYAVIAVIALVSRLLYTPFALVGAALHNDKSGFRRYTNTTKAFPWFGEYWEMWRGLERWLRGKPRDHRSGYL